MMKRLCAFSLVFCTSQCLAAYVDRSLQIAEALNNAEISDSMKNAVTDQNRLIEPNEPYIPDWVSINRDPFSLLGSNGKQSNVDDEEIEPTSEPSLVNRVAPQSSQSSQRKSVQVNTVPGASWNLAFNEFSMQPEVDAATIGKSKKSGNRGNIESIEDTWDDSSEDAYINKRPFYEQKKRNDDDNNMYKSKPNQKQKKDDKNYLYEPRYRKDNTYDNDDDDSWGGDDKPDHRMYDKTDEYKSDGKYDKYGYDKYDMDKYGKDKYGNNKYDDSYGDDKYGDDKFDDGKYDDGNYDDDIFGYDKYGYDKYGFDKYGFDKYGYDKYGNNKYGNDKYGNDKYGNDKYDNDKYGNDKYSNDKYGNDKYDDVRYDDDKHDRNKYDNKKYGNSKPGNGKSGGNGKPGNDKKTLKKPVDKQQLYVIENRWEKMVDAFTPFIQGSLNYQNKKYKKNGRSFCPSYAEKYLTLDTWNEKIDVYISNVPKLCMMHFEDGIEILKRTGDVGDVTIFGEGSLTVDARSVELTGHVTDRFRTRVWMKVVFDETFVNVDLKTRWDVSPSKVCLKKMIVTNVSNNMNCRVESLKVGNEMICEGSRKCKRYSRSICDEYLGTDEMRENWNADPTHRLPTCHDWSDGVFK